MRPVGGESFNRRFWDEHLNEYGFQLVAAA